MRITRIYTQQFPARRFIGKKYGDSDRVNGNFGSKWGEFFDNGWFDVLERSAGSTSEEGDEYRVPFLRQMRIREG